MPTALEISDLHVTLGGHKILAGINAEIEAGEFIGIFGPNGAGKTTLVRAILGTLRPQAGSVKIFGQSPGRASREIGYLPQGNPGLELTALSARAVIEAACGGERWGVPWPSRATQAEIDRVLELTEAAAQADRPFSVLSGGERQRVMLAQALLGRPKILVLDEPLASLDPKNQALLIERIAEVKERTGTTVLFVAHDMNPLLHVMDRVLYMAGGGAVLGEVDRVVNSESLTRLYGFPIEVIRAENRIFVVSKEGNVTESAHHD
ncbi:MAG: ABC transporter ATP-binding protein [Methylacidiphilales bacterium]|nr:ABC transporter ATP-binding protein [Candidatus Methylacidiphilales bacterium]